MLLPTTPTLLLLALLSAPLPLPVSAEQWFQFCDDTACSQNCGISVSGSNAGCLEHQAGRKSIKTHGSSFAGTYLVHSPGDACDCQQDCTAISGIGAPSCIDISGKKGESRSYRFQLTTCKELEGGPGTGDNCKPDGDDAVADAAAEKPKSTKRSKMRA
ncbi:uncharacterized protein GGS25DRAFT_316989 [Hypoxylon fragiforme]|uniref:uncharacterized protein n=1 Tax=Hypoxylon fragiforme TaxID=63214 RepID=UPI0020C6C3E1|nr:uncharacterized protein GGS25DRAFT_316989 [Hypoxylon fragiforme]KAI2607050.1 hypothetical protein GGS25DRAFT_316989 [Hypoxylon fragiforme]